MSSLPRPSEKEFLEKALRDCEDELASSLCTIKTQDLYQEFSKRCLLSNESYTSFTSLDSSLDSQLQVRYLVRLASERVKTDPALGHNLIEVLDTLEGVPSSLTDKLKQAMTVTNEDFEAAGVSSVTISHEDSEQEIEFSKRDQNMLTELLVKVSHKWVEVAISLGLQQHEIAECKVGSNITSLFKLVGFWLANSSNTTLKKLTDTLCSGLVNETTLAKSVEEEVKTSSEKAETYLKSKQLALSSNSRFSSSSRIVSQSLPTTEVADGKSTLLQVQARPRESVVSYQWNKDGQPLANGSRYSGVDEDILVVRHASQGTEGEYTCCVSLQDRQVTSDPITLTVHFPPAKELLLNVYFNIKVPTSKDDWPPIVSKTFINLALIKSTNNQKKKEDFSVQGDADDIIFEKEKVEYEDMFSEYRSRELILVEGRPGSGKTTLVHKIVKDWASGKIICKSKLVFLVKLRLLNLDTSLGNILDGFYSVEKLKSVVADIVGRDGDGTCFVFDGLDEYLSPNEEESYIHKLLDRSRLPKCMIIVSSRPSATEQVHKDHITKRVEVFGFSKVQISEYVDSFPFDEEGGTSVSSITRASQLKDYLLSHPNIHDMCYLPVHAAMICFLFQFAENISSTQTQVYGEFTRSIIHRHLARNLNKHVARQALRSAVRSLDNLDKLHAESFKNLCHLAYGMTVKSRQVISSQELQTQLGGSGSFSEEEGLGLLTICPTLHQTGFHQSYVFLHLTFQEFLTAYYIANYMDDSQQMDILQKYSDMKTVWLFYSGLVDFEKAPEKLDTLVKHGLESCNYAFESHQKIFCDGVVKVNNGMLDFFDLMTPTDFLSVGYVIKTSTHPVTNLDIGSYFDQHDDDRNCLVLSQLQESNLSQLKLLKFWLLVCDADTKSLCEVLKNAKNIKRLKLKFKHMDSHYSELLACQISQCATYLHHLTLSCNGSPECFQTFFSSLKVPQTSIELHLKDLDAQCLEALSCGTQAKHLNVEVDNCNITKHGMKCLLVCLQDIKEIEMLFRDNKFSSDGLAGLAEISGTIQVRTLNLACNNIASDCVAGLAGLKCMSGLKTLFLSNNNIGPEGAAALGCGLRYLTGLESLSLNFNHIDRDGAVALASELKYVTGLTELELSDNNIGDEGAAALASELKYVTGLKYLGLFYNSIGDEGAVALASELKYVTGLKGLELSDNNIGDEGAAALASELKYVTGLESLMLSDNNIGDEGAAALASELKYVTGLVSLELSDNYIGNEGAAALASELEYVTGLTKLELGNNYIEDDGAIALYLGLTGHSKLKTLDLSQNPVDETGVEALIRLYRECESLQKLKCDGI